MTARTVAAQERLAWVDLLRIAACFLVVFSHCCDPFVARFDEDPESFFTGVCLGSLVRPCVPLFVMMTGVLLLPVRERMGAFYRKRLGRLFPPLVGWSLLLPLLFFAYLGYIAPGTQNPAIAGDHSWAGTLVKLRTFLFNFNFDTTPLWYLYMLAGLYLAMPLLSDWLRHADRREMRLFLRVWGLTLLLPYVGMIAPVLGYAGNYGNPGLFGICDWNQFGTFHYVSGFIGYLVLAHYLVRFPLDWSRRKLLWAGSGMFLAGYLVTMLGYLFMQRRYPGNYAYLEIVWYFAGINVFLMTFPIFAAISRIRIRPRPWIARLAALTFGIYLCHFVFVAAAYDLFDRPGLPPVVRIAAMSVTAFVASGGLVWLLRRFAPTRPLVS